MKAKDRKGSFEEENIAYLNSPKPIRLDKELNPASRTGTNLSSALKSQLDIDSQI